MGRLILAPNAEATPDQQHTTRFGMVQAEWMGSQLSSMVINSAFSGKSPAARNTLQRIISLQEGSVLHAAMSELDGSQLMISPGAIRVAGAGIRRLHHQQVKSGLEHDGTVLVVASPNPLRAYIQLLEGLTAKEAAEHNPSQAMIRIYDADDPERGRPIQVMTMQPSLERVS